MRSRMSDGRRALVSREVHARCVDLVAREGGASFFSRPDWRARLAALVAAAAPAPFESADDQARAIEDELARSRSILNDRLKTNTVAHICLPWGISGVTATPAQAHRLSIRVRQPPARTARRPRGRRSLLAEAAAEPLHHAPAGARPAVLVFMTSAFPEDVGVAIVCHNNRATLGATLASLDAAGCPRAGCSSSTPPAPTAPLDWLRDAYPDVRVRALPEQRRAESGAEHRHPRDPAAVRVPDGRRRAGAAGRDPAPADARWPPTARSASAVPIVVHAADPGTIQYAGGSLHFICEAINPWMNRPLADRGAARADVGVASGNGLLLDRATRPSPSACSTSATSWARTMATSRIGCGSPATGSSSCPTRSCCTAAARAATGCSTTRSGTAGTSC